MSRLWNVYPSYRVLTGVAPPSVEPLGDPMTVGAFDEADLRRLMDRMNLLGGAAVEVGGATALLFDGDPSAKPRTVGVGRGGGAEGS